LLKKLAIERDFGMGVKNHSAKAYHIGWPAWQRELTVEGAHAEDAHPPLEESHDLATSRPQRVRTSGNGATRACGACAGGEPRATSI
jgi:hypothetical protein